MLTSHWLLISGPEMLGRAGQMVEPLWFLGQPSPSPTSPNFCTTSFPDLGAYQSWAHLSSSLILVRIPLCSSLWLLWVELRSTESSLPSSPALRGPHPGPDPRGLPLALAVETPEPIGTSWVLKDETLGGWGMPGFCPASSLSVVTHHCVDAAWAHRSLPEGV